MKKSTYNTPEVSVLIRKSGKLFWLAENDLSFEKIMPLRAVGLQHTAQNETYSELGWE